MLVKQEKKEITQEQMKKTGEKVKEKSWLAAEWGREYEDKTMTESIESIELDWFFALTALIDWIE